VVSGGHTQLIQCDRPHHYVLLGTTRDDAVGECFDKVARLLDLPYPGGPSIQRAAEGGNPKAFKFPRAMLRDESLDFSYSGLKTAVLYTLRDHPDAGRADLAASFQEAVVDVLFSKTMYAAKAFNVKSILVAGGVSANQALRNAFLNQSEFPVHIPPLSLCTDNAAMIASAGYFHYIAGHSDPLDLDVLPTWPIG